MFQVGERLAGIAQASNQSDEVDAFGRSAINRYYYACFLKVRTAVRATLPNLAIVHKQLPENLRGAFSKEVRKEIDRLLKQGVISARDAESHRVVLNAVVGQLAEVLEQAYRTRVIADYEPERRAARDGGGIALGGVSMGHARDWYRRADSNVGRFMRLWGELGH